MLTQGHFVAQKLVKFHIIHCLNDSNTTVGKQTDSMPRHLLLNVSSEIDFSEVDDLSIGSSSSNGTTVYVSEKELYSQIMAA